MSIVEKVDAAVEYRFPSKNNTLTIKQLEEYIFNARMRGADENSRVVFGLERDYSNSAYGGTTHVVKMSVKVTATMGGFPVLAEVPKQQMSTRTKARVIAGAVVTTPLLVLLAILMVVF